MFLNFQVKIKHIFWGLIKYIFGEEINILKHCLEDETILQFNQCFKINKKQAYSGF